MAATSPEVTRLLASIRGGAPGAVEELWDAVYGELRELARQKLAREAGAPTLQPTMLVNEAYVRLSRNDPERWENRAHFFAAAAEAMRRVLIDRARHHGARKRSGSGDRIPLDELDALAEESADELLAIDGALQRLEHAHPRPASVVKLRFFAGLSNEDAADALDVSRTTVVNDWRFARAWLQRELERDSESAPGEPAEEPADESDEEPAR